MSDKKTKKTKKPSSGINIEVGTSKNTDPKTAKTDVAPTKDNVDLDKELFGATKTTDDESVEDNIDKNKTVEEAMDEIQEAEKDLIDNDDSILQETSTEIDENILAETSSQLTEEKPKKKEPKKPKKPKKVKKPRKKPNYKKILIVLLALILLAGAGTAAWYFLLKDVASDQSSGQNSATTEQAPAQTFTPDKVVYAYQASMRDPETIYSRPAEGGDRKEIIKLEKNEEVLGGDASGDVVTFYSNQGLYASTDNGDSFSKIVELSGGQEITSLAISSENDAAVYGLLSTDNNKNTVKTVGLDGRNSKDIFTSDQSGVFVYAWSQSRNKLVYSEGCYACDQTDLAPAIRDIDSNKVDSLDVKIDTQSDIGSNFSVSDDFAQAIVAESSSLKNDGQPTDGATLYTLSAINLSSQEKTKVTAVSSANEQDPNGVEPSTGIRIGFVAGSNTPYYSYGKKVFTSENGTETLVLEAKDPILHLPFVGSEMIVAGAGKSVDDYKLFSQDIASKKATEIYLGDSNAIIFGVTTK